MLEKTESFISFTQRKKVTSIIRIFMQATAVKLSAYIFSDLHIIGKMKSPSRRRMIVKYVKENLEALYAEWNKITAK